MFLFVKICFYFFCYTKKIVFLQIKTKNFIFYQTNYIFTNKVQKIYIFDNFTIIFVYKQAQQLTKFWAYKLTYRLVWT